MDSPTYNVPQANTISKNWGVGPQKQKSFQIPNSDIYICKFISVVGGNWPGFRKGATDTQPGYLL